MKRYFGIDELLSEKTAEDIWNRVNECLALDDFRVKATVPCKIQFGSGWWFNDQRDGREALLRAFANLSLLPRFVGMLTDSRSFVSYTRHEYFRRIFCNLLGEWVDNGEYPYDEEVLEKIVKGVCCDNARSCFGF